MVTRKNVVGQLGALACAAFLSLGGEAGAQARPSTANGIKLGDGRLHAMLDLESRFDSTAWIRSISAGNIVASPEWLNHFRPSLRYELPGTWLDVGLSGELDYVLYTGLITRGSNTASRLEGAADLDLQLNKEGQVGFRLTNHFGRSDRTNNPAVQVGVLSLANQLTASLPLRPGGGALEITPEAAWAIEFFQPIVRTEAALNEVRRLNYGNVHAAVDGRWRFLPKTALVANLSYDHRTYLVDATVNPPAGLFRFMAGLSGLLTQRLALNVRAGWAQDFRASRAKTLIGNADLTYVINETSTLRGGYLRTLEPVPSFGVYGDDRVFVESRMVFAGRLTFYGRLSFDYLSFYGRASEPSARRNDSLVNLELSPEYQFRPWLTGAVGYALSHRVSSLRIVTDLQSQSANYTRHEVYVRVSFSY